MKKFLDINLGHVISIALWLITMAVTFGAVKSLVGQHSKEIDELRTNQKAIVEKLAKINTDGSSIVNFQTDIKAMRDDLNKIMLEQARNSGLTIRVTKLEEYIPKIDVLNVKVDWVKEHLTKISSKEQ